MADIGREAENESVQNIHKYMYIYIYIRECCRERVRGVERVRVRVNVHLV